jgi:hypothetical protein
MQSLEIRIRNVFIAQPSVTPILSETNAIQNDIPQEIKKTFEYKSWENITLKDWQNIGASVDVIKGFMTPDSFRYYIPSLMIACLTNNLAFEMAIDSLLPSNQKRIPKGEWWENFQSGFNPDQIETIKSLLNFIFENSPANSVSKHLAARALKEIWA